MKNLLFITGIFLFFLVCSSKYIKEGQSFTVFNKHKWAYLTKFALAPGQGKFEAKFQFSKKSTTKDNSSHIPIKLLIFKDDIWGKVLTSTTCESKTNLAFQQFDVQVPVNGDWSKTIELDLHQQGNVQVWYFAISDCQKQVNTLRGSGNRIRWELKILNSDGSHFSEEENNMTSKLLFLLVLVGAILVAYSAKFYKFLRAEEGIDYPTLLLTIAIFFEFLSLLFELIHTNAYATNGKGIFLLNFAHQAFSVLSQFIVACLLLLVAYGWSIHFNTFPEMDIFIPVGIILAIVHLMIVGLGRITENQHSRFHDYDSWVGIVLVIIRFLLNGYFYYLYKFTKEKAKGEEASFYSKLGPLATLYFQAFPLILLMASIFVAPHNQHKFVTIGTTLIQIISLGILMIVFTTKKSTYYSISMKGKVFLPTNKLH